MASEKTPFLSEEEKRTKILQSSYTERFYMLMKLIRVNKMLSNAIIIQSNKK